MNDRDGGPAFPSGNPLDTRSVPTGGMSLRDYFAAHAPVVPAEWGEEQTAALQNDPAAMCAAWSFAYAKAMLAERAK